MIELVDVWKSYGTGQDHAVRGLSFEVQEGETLILLGPSGCGKTTTLKMINRLIEMTSGKILVKGKDISSVDAVSLRRKMGFVIQNIGLFPHMTVNDNVGIVPRLLGWDKERRQKRIDELLELVGLSSSDFGHRYPTELSGGQQQRIGVARALASDPPVVLLDEPFGALDPITREQLQGEFKKLKKRLKKTMVFVTHDIFEAVTLGDRICLMKDGELAQIGTPKEMVTQPANRFVEDFLGQHRYQLRLTLSSLKELFLQEDLGPVGDEDLATVSYEANLVDALEQFEESGKDQVAVENTEGEILGTLKRAQVLQKV